MDCGQLLYRHDGGPPGRIQVDKKRAPIWRADLRPYLPRNAPSITMIARPGEPFGKHRPNRLKDWVAAHRDDVTTSPIMEASDFARTQANDTSKP